MQNFLRPNFIKINQRHNFLESRNAILYGSSVSTSFGRLYRGSHMHFLTTKSLIRSSYDSFWDTSPLMLMTARPLRRSCPIVERKNVLMSFSLEKLSSAEATVTGRVNAIQRATQRFGYTSWRRFSWRNVSNSKEVVCGDSWGRLVISWTISVLFSLSSGSMFMALQRSLAVDTSSCIWRGRFWHCQFEQCRAALN